MGGGGGVGGRLLSYIISGKKPINDEPNNKPPLQSHNTVVNNTFTGTVYFYGEFAGPGIPGPSIPSPHYCNFSGEWKVKCDQCKMCLKSEG